MNLGKTIASLGFGGVLWAGAAGGAEWETGAAVSAGGYYTDNVCLANRNSEGEWVTTARPDVALRGKGARASLAIEASAEYNSRAESDIECGSIRGEQLSNRESVIPRVRMLGELELLQDWLVLEAEANAHRTAIDPFVPGVEDNFSGRDNTNILWSYSVGARVQRRLFDASELFLRYTYDEQFNSVGQYGDSTQDLVEFSLATRPEASRLSYGISGRYTRVEYDSSSRAPAFDNELASAQLDAAFDLSASWQVNGYVGEERNEYTSVFDDIDGSFWDVGVRWTPNARVQVDAGYGERFFGETPRLAVRYRHKRVDLTARYQRTLSLPRNLRALVEDFDPDDIFGPDPDALPGDPTGPGGQPTFLGDSPVLNERFSVNWRFTARRTTFNLSASDSRQERTEDGDEATFSGISFTAVRELTRNLNATARVGWDRREGEGRNLSTFAEESRSWRGGLGLTRQLGNATSLSVAYQYITRESDFELNDYDENRLILTIRHEFL